MRILAIRGENLASLAAPFAVDLAAEPIASTGIFAITGETGAGKSTILDALCLALYGRYPRVASGRREDTPDPSGDAVSASDGRAILRRGAAQGWAEVDFVGQDGVPYRVRWEAVRARGRADGRLQSDRRMLHRLDDGSAVESGKNAVAAAIEQRTDLTFDQFRRTVLLAQGEFDAFLLAGEGERAELLEKITGTAVYSEISKRVHAGTEARRRTVSELEIRRGAVGPLDAAGRNALETERAAIEAEIAAKTTQRDALVHGLDLARRIAALQVQVEQADASARTARAARDAALPDRDQLTRLDAVEPIRRCYDTLATAERDAVETKAALAAVSVEAAAAEAAVVRAGACFEVARHADADAEAVLQGFGPVWSEAERLDGVIAAAEEEAVRAAESVTRLNAVAALARDHLADIHRRLARATAERDAAARQCVAWANRAALADRAEEIAGLFRKRALLRANLATERGVLIRAREDAARCDAAIRAEEARIANLRAERELVTVRRAAAIAALAALDPQALQTRAAALAECLDGLREAETLAQDHAVLLDDLSSARADEEGAAADLADARSRRDAAVRAGEAATRARGEIAALADLAEESVSREALRLRSLLVAGEACPVCGGVDHPHRHPLPGEGDALAGIAAAMRARREALDADLLAAAIVLTNAAGDEAAAHARIAAASRAAQAAGAGLAATRAAFETVRCRLGAACTRAGLDAQLIAGLDPSAGLTIAAPMEAALAARSALAGSLDAVRDGAVVIDALARSGEAASAAIEVAVEALDERRSHKHAADLDAQRAATHSASIEERIESLGREAEPFLAAADLSLADLDADALVATARAREIGDVFRTLRDRHAGLEAQVRGLTSDLAVADSRRLSVESEAAEVQAEAVRRDAHLDRSRSARMGLLDGEATASHRHRTGMERRAAGEALHRAQGALGVATTARASAVALREGARVGHARVVAQRDAALEAFRSECDTIPVGTVTDLLRVPPESRERLREGLARLMRDLDAAETAFATRRADLAGLDGTAQIDVAASRVEADALAQMIGTRQQRLGAIDGERRRDDEARRMAADLREAVAVAGAELAIWEAVDDAVGSASGDKFRRFAQGVTLEHLIGLANEQLGALSPRYRLARSSNSDLALHVVDADMGDELRATRSLSGGERFLVSLALALALSGLEGRQSFVDTLFIDEGFGSLDAETLDLAVDALETLQGRGRKVGVITHVLAMIDRIAVQVRVEKRGNGRSVVRIIDGAGPPA